MQEINDSLRGRDFVSIHDFTPAEVAYILEVGAKLKEEKKQGVPHPHLAGKTLGMIFQKSSTRTRVAFEVGMYQLGGHALFKPPGYSVRPGRNHSGYGPGALSHAGWHYDTHL